MYSNINPLVYSYLKSNFLSKLFFLWVIPLLRRGSKFKLNWSDLEHVSKSDEAAFVGKLLKAEWDKELRNKSGKDASLACAIFRAFGAPYCALGLIVFTNECIINIGRAICMGYLIRYFQSAEKYDQNYGLGFAGGVVLLALMPTILHQTYSLQIMRIGMRARVAVSSLIYSKMLRLSVCSYMKINPGQIANILGNDLTRFDQLSFSFHYLWVGPLQAGLVTTLLWLEYLGWSCLIGLGLILVYIPLQLLFSKWFKHLRNQTARAADDRINLLTEILNGIRTIKMNSWDVVFSKRVDQARKKELRFVKLAGFLRAMNGTLFAVSSKLIIFLTALAQYLTGEKITAENIFVSFALYNTIRIIMTFCFPMAIINISEVVVSLRRVKEFLMEEEICENISLKTLPVLNSQVQLIASGVNITVGQAGLELRDVNFCVEGPSLVCITGPVGSGKSTLLNAILGELPLRSGDLECLSANSVSYAAQDPWIFGGCIKENILFKQDFRPDWYHQVVRACALEENMQALSHGDATLLEDQGLNLSGGQRARISLARTAYSNSDLILLDDPFASLDGRVAYKIFHECVLRLMRNKIVVLVTNTELHLQMANVILQIEDDGSVKTICNPAITEMSRIIEEEPLPPQEANEGRIMPRCMSSTEPEVGQILTSSKTEGKTGTFQYFGVVSLCRSIFQIIFPTTAGICLLVVVDLWIKLWVAGGSSDSDIIYSWLPPIVKTEEGIVIVYSVIVGLLIATFFLRSTLFFSMCVCISARLHFSMSKGVIGSPLSFFERTPSGQILSRFSSDTGTLDDILPQSLFDAVESLQSGIAVLIVVSIVAPITILPVLILLIFLVILRGFYLKSSKAVKQLEAGTRGDMLTRVKSAFRGIPLIRCTNGMVEKQIGDFHAIQDTHSSAWFIYVASGRWIAMYLDFVAVLFTAMVIFSFFIFSTKGDNSTTYGLVISSALTLTGMLQLAVRQSAEVENQLVSLERVKEFSEGSLPSEEMGTIEAENAQKWPQESTDIEFADYFLKYGESDETAALKNISLCVKSGEKVGIVGRTGSGKSSMIASLLRLVPSAAQQGAIFIGGVNICSIPFRVLRSNITIIPQSMDLFSGTLRYNLDPEEKFGDDELHRVLNLLNCPSLSTCDLDEPLISENLSMGQKQFLCFVICCVCREQS
ncbi:multidrug resistance-associated protein 4-like [Folsomia candida]|uniref:multidrug resistance-associated protein 4-like n=1 Tax=Folsomia candida TaxID=158441 RepID=UPI001604C3B5|nr:multidrug resistance-associated protein 4-like [Folsomia candida]